nr:GDP-L-galactose phosphorylase 1-like [Tanacetum cinerariifolium]
GQEEILFQFESSDDGEVKFYPSAPIDAEKSPSVVAINVSPIEYGHVLLIPRILECLPQRIDNESFLLALYMAAEAGNPYFRLGYNSLGAFATINHLHFQDHLTFLHVNWMEKQCYAEKQALGEVSAELLDTQVNPAVWEISGHMVLKRKEDFDGATEANAWRLLAEVSLSEDRSLLYMCFDTLLKGASSLYPQGR